ncbi:MAG: hypothetical protein ACLUAR_16755 [Pilosibacter sp.]
MRDYDYKTPTGSVLIFCVGVNLIWGKEGQGGEPAAGHASAAVWPYFPWA